MPRMNRSPRNSVTDRPSGWRLLLRRQRRLLKPAGWLVLAAVIGSAGVMALHAAGPRTGSGGSLATMRERLGAMTAASGLRVNDIIIEGRANTPEPVLRAAIGVSKGDPILGFSLEETRANIEKIQWVEHATVERRLPGTLIINLQERRPFAIWQNQGKFVLVDRAGQVVANQDVTQFRHLPLIVGLGAPNAAAILLDALRDRPALAEKVSASVRVGERRWNLRLVSGGDVMLPEGHEVPALDRLMQLQQDQSVLDRPLAAIDLRLPDRLVFRPKSEVKETAAPLPPAHPSNPPTVPVVAKKPN
jgi:cell division protein FtsQ